MPAMSLAPSVPATRLAALKPTLRLPMRSRLVNSLILQRDGARHAVAELHGVGELVDAGDRAAAARQSVGVVSRIVGPRGRELRDGLTHREAGELDEGVVDADRTACDRAGVGVLRGRSGRNRAAAEGLVNGRTGHRGLPL